MPARRAFRGRSWRPATTWAGFVPSAQVNVPASSKVLIGTVANLEDEEVTIRRIRGLLTVASDQIAASELQLGALGALVATNTSIAAGVASLPDPFTDVEEDIWMLYTHIAGSVQVASAVGVEPQFLTHYVLDAKSMRKLPSGRALAFVIANSHATFGYAATLGVRVLGSLTGR